MDGFERQNSFQSNFKSNERLECKDKNWPNVDVKRYSRYLGQSEMSDEEIAEFLKAFWVIIVSLVDVGFKIHPVQLLEHLDRESRTSHVPCRSETQRYGASE